MTPPTASIQSHPPKTKDREIICSYTIFLFYISSRLKLESAFCYLSFTRSARRVLWGGGPEQAIIDEGDEGTTQYLRADPQKHRGI